MLALAGLIGTFGLLVLASAGQWDTFGIGTTSLGQTIVVWTVAYVLIGAVLAVRRTATHRAVPWLSTLALPLAVPLVPWLGAQVQQAYLRPFDMSLGTNGDGLGNVRAGLWLLLVFGGMLLLPIAYLGWIRYLNSSIDARGSWTSWVPMLSVGALLGLALASAVLFTAGQSGKTARNVATQGGEVPEYFGLRADHVCVKLVSADSPFLGIRPPEDRPVITFGADGDRITLWVPPQKASGAGAHRTGGTSSTIRLEDAQIRKVGDAKVRCVMRPGKNRSP
ncbi:hypothetical protein [Streptomyces sp. HC307]|uniref:hypothetical protein n=1 Tax=Streptomyces flavusporus TaxID=3385496 RepID=UPI003916D080